MLLPRTTLLQLDRPSLLRAIVLALGSFVFSLHLGGFPNIQALHASHWQALAVFIAICSLLETARCIERRWSLYQAGILLLLYTEVMILGLAVFLFFYP